jgi:ribosome-binding factor A
MPTQRQLRLNNLLQAEISDIIRRELKDPDLGFWTITGAQVSADIRHARIYVSVLGDGVAKRKTIGILGRARGLIRALLRDRLDLRTIPELIFRLDDTAERAQQMEVVLRQVAVEQGEEDTAGEPADVPAPDEEEDADDPDA